MKTPDDHYRAMLDSMTEDEALEFVSGILTMVKG